MVGECVDAAQPEGSLERRKSKKRKFEKLVNWEKCVETITHTLVDSLEVGWQMGENNLAQESVDEVVDWMPQSMNLAPAGRLKQKRLDENIEVVVVKQEVDKRIEIQRTSTNIFSWMSKRMIIFHVNGRE